MFELLNGIEVIVTGGAGFIGYHLTKRLSELGASVHIFDVSKNERINSLDDSIKFHQIDLCDFEKVKSGIESTNPQKIFHLAAKVDVKRSIHSIDVNYTQNIISTVNLIKSLENIDIDCFINTGTCEEYGDNQVPFTENQLPNPVSPYSASKSATTLFCTMCHKSLGIPTVTLRPFLTYGPFQDTKMLIPHTIKSVLDSKKIEMTAGLQTRELNYVSDIVEGFILASTEKKAVGEIINIGNGVEYRIIDVVKKIVKLMDSDVEISTSLPYRPGEAMNFYCDNTKAKKILGWESKVSLDEGLKKTIEWYKNGCITKD